jgi:hypothetical protein
MIEDIDVHPVNNHLDWTHPEDLKDYKKHLKNFIYTKKGKVRKCRLSPLKHEPETFIKCQIRIFQSVHRINAYMSFRAFSEFPEVPAKERYQFTPKYYYDNFKNDCYEFFGVKCCPCCGEIIEDTQNPEAYEEFCKYEKEIKSEQPTLH